MNKKTSEVEELLRIGLGLDDNQTEIARNIVLSWNTQKLQELVEEIEKSIGLVLIGTNPRHQLKVIKQYLESIKKWIQEKEEENG